MATRDRDAKTVYDDSLPIDERAKAATRILIGFAARVREWVSTHVPMCGEDVLDSTVELRLPDKERILDHFREDIDVNCCGPVWCALDDLERSETDVRVAMAMMIPGGFSDGGSWRRHEGLFWFEQWVAVYRIAKAIDLALIYDATGSIVTSQTNYPDDPESMLPASTMVPILRYQLLKSADACESVAGSIETWLRDRHSDNAKRLREELERVQSSADQWEQLYSQIKAQNLLAVQGAARVDELARAMDVFRYGLIAFELAQAGEHVTSEIAVDYARLLRRQKAMEAAGHPGEVKPWKSPVQLRGRGQPVFVLDVEKRPLTDAAYEVIASLIDAGEAGLSKDALEAVRSSARSILRGLAERDPDWKRVIGLAGQTGVGYRLIVPPPPLAT